MGFRFSKIENKKQIDLFHRFLFSVYKDYPEWIPPFRFEIEQIFDPSKNSFYGRGECERFLMYDENKNPVARFAVMNHEDQRPADGIKAGGLGFIEMINSQKVADTMIRFAASWHRKRGTPTFRGPVNFGENNNYWGLLVENFKEPPVYGMFYHPPYYKKLLEKTGAEKTDDHRSYKRSFSEPLPDRLLRITERIEKRPGVHIRAVDRSNLERDAMAIRSVYNRAWREQDIAGREPEFTELAEETIREMVRNLKRVLIPESVLLAFVDGEPASFIFSIPDLNEISAQTNGRLRWWHLPKLFGIKKRAKHLRVIAFGTVPKFRKMGLEALMFVRGIELTRKAVPSLDYLEGGWVSEKNWLMQRSLEALGCHHHKTHRTYLWRVDG